MLFIMYKFITILLFCEFKIVNYICKYYNYDNEYIYV